MADGSQWKSMSGSSRFGIYRESSKRRRTAGGRCCYSVAIFLVITTVICLTALSITTGKGRKRLKVGSERSPENGKILVNATGRALIIEEITTPTPDLKATEVGQHQEPSEPSMPRPEMAVPTRRFKFPEDGDREEHSTQQPDEKEPSNEEPSFASRQGRIMNEPAVSPYKMRSPPRFLNPPTSSNQRPNVIMFSTMQAGDFSEDFAQMTPYGNGYDAIKNSQEILDYAADDRPLPIFSQSPAIKFTGVYVRGPAEEIENISLDKKKHQLNGHAYSATTDPFKAYKPAHPAEINHLATKASEQDSGIRFSNKIVRPSTTPTPLESDPHGDIGASGSGTLTQAIFHPYDSALMTSHQDAVRPASSSSSSTRDKKARPLKIMLDIYPLHQSDLLEQGSVHQVVEGNRHRKPVVVRPPLPPVAPLPTQSNRMIVHLNLFPKKTQKNSSPRRETLPTSMTLVPGGGSQFQDRTFDLLERPATTRVSFPLRRSGGSHNNSVPDESIEIAESYPVPVPDGPSDRDSRATFLMSDDQVIEHSAPYSFVIGRSHSRAERNHEDDQDDGGGEGGVFIMEDLEELEHGGGEDMDKEQEDTEDTNGGHKDIGGSQGERTVFHEEEDSGNGYKVVSFQVSGGMMDGAGEEVIDEGGILRARGKPDGGSRHESEDNHGLIATGEPSKYRPEEVYGLISGSLSSNQKGNSGGKQNTHDHTVNSKNTQNQHDGSQANLRPDNHDKGIRIKKINPPRFFPRPEQNRANQDVELHDVPYDDDKLPIGTVGEMGASEIDDVPGYNEGTVIEPRADNKQKNHWPRTEMLQQTNGTVLSTTTGLPIVFPDI